MSIDNKTLFFYVVIFIAIVFIFSKMAIGLNILFGTLIAAVVLYYLYTNYDKTQNQENKIKSMKGNLILPDPESAKGYEDIVRHLYSIQCFYVHNADAYSELINGFKNFFRIYEDTIIVPRYAGRNYEMMVDQKRKSMNALHSIIHKLPDDYLYTDKLERGITAIEEVLQKYLDDVEYMQRLYLHENNHNIETKLIDESGVMPRDESYNSDFSYDIF